MKYNPEEQFEIITKGCADILPKGILLEKLKKSYETKVPLKIKLGVDPTGTDIHLGHTVVIQRLKAFQDCGHRVMFLIGDYTGMIGDPSGRSSTRPMLSHDDLLKNSSSYKEQVFNILDKEKTEFLYNSQWLSKLNFLDIIRLTSHITVAQMLERDDFNKRYNENEPISLVEFIYPLVQGYDSVAMECDVELGGQDQLFNLLMGRELQKHYGVNPQAILTVPLLEGTDGVRKMSKSYGNVIGIKDSYKDIFGKVMSIPDTLIFRYFELLTQVNAHDTQMMKKEIENGANPRDYKMQLASLIVESLKGKETAELAQEEFINVFSKKSDIPLDTPSIIIENDIAILDFMIKYDLCESKSQARRLLVQGAVTLNGEKIAGDDFILTTSQIGIIKVGKKRFIKLIDN